MKSTDLTPGLHAAHFTGSRRRYTGGPNHGQEYGWHRVRVVKVEPFTQTDLKPFLSHPWSVKGEVIVQPLTDAGRKTGKPILVMKRDLACTWAEHVALADEAMAARDEHHRLYDESAKELNGAIRRIHAIVGRKHESLPYEMQKANVKPHADYSGMNGGKDDITAIELLALLETAYQAGRESGLEDGRINGLADANA